MTNRDRQRIVEEIKLSSVIMTSSNGNIFLVTGLMCGEFTGDRWSPLTNARDADRWCFLWSAHWISSWVNNREASDLRRAHYDVIVMVVMVASAVPVASMAPLGHWPVSLWFITSQKYKGVNAYFAAYGFKVLCEISKILTHKPRNLHFTGC